MRAAAVCLVAVSLASGACVARSTLWSAEGLPPDEATAGDPRTASGDSPGSDVAGGDAADAACGQPASLAELRCDLQPGGCPLPALCTDLVALYHFDNVAADGESLTQVHDFSAAGNDLGCAVPDCPTLAAGRFSGAFAFTRGPYLEAPPSPSLDIPGAVTVSAWFHADDLSLNDYQVIVAKAHATLERSNYWLGLDEDRFVVTFHDGTSWRNHVTPSSYAEGAWYHLVAILEPNADRVRLYVNGLIAIDATETADPAVETESLWIGWAPRDSGVAGIVDEVAVWRRALAPDELLSLYP